MTLGAWPLATGPLVLRTEPAGSVVRIVEQGDAAAHIGPDQRAVGIAELLVKEAQDGSTQ